MSCATKAQVSLSATLDSTPSQSEFICCHLQDAITIMHFYFIDRSLLCGVPMLLLPFFGDQHSNAQKIEAGMLCFFVSAYS
jgi:hypothetical protein